MKIMTNEEIITRLLELRRAKLIGPILADEGRIQVCSSEINPRDHIQWGCRREVMQLIESFEGVQHERKGVCSETRCDDGTGARRAG